MRELWLMRHGESLWNVTGQHTGQTDVALSRRGEEQARALGRKLGGRKFDRVWVSPLSRARETCRLAGYLDGALVCDDLAERSYGKFEGLTWAEIRERAPGWTTWTGGAPDGESVDDVAARARRVLAMAEPFEFTALFAHGHFFRVLTACYLGLPPALGKLFAMSTATYSVLGRERGAPVIRHWGVPPE